MTDGNDTLLRDAYSTSTSGTPEADSSPTESGDWTLVSNTVSSGTRTIVATRANDTLEILTIILLVLLQVH